MGCQDDRRRHECSGRGSDREGVACCGLALGTSEFRMILTHGAAVIYMRIIVVIWYSIYFLSSTVIRILDKTSSSRLLLPERKSSCRKGSTIQHRRANGKNIILITGSRLLLGMYIDRTLSNPETRLSRHPLVFST